jgi:DNA-binding transcriptional LysR family regulator
MRGRDVADLNSLAAIVEHGTFARAAAHLRVSPSALSQTIRGLEERLGVRLLNRTTRSVAPTDAGLRLLSRVTPAMRELDSAIADVTSSRGRVAGRLRLNLPRMGGWLIAPLLGRFHDAHPDIILDVTLEDAVIDIVKGGFEAGMRLGERLEKDMIALKVGGDYEMMAVSSPEYFARFGVPTHPHELHRHRCINWRWPSNHSLYRWEFERGRETLEIAVEGPLIVNDFDLAFRGALAGAGIAYGYDFRMEQALEAGALQRVLKPWSPSFAGLSIYYPSRRQVTATLQAFIDFLRSEGLIRAGRRSSSKAGGSVVES